MIISRFCKLKNYKNFCTKVKKHLSPECKGCPHAVIILSNQELYSNNRLQSENLNLIAYNPMPVCT